MDKKVIMNNVPSCDLVRLWVYEPKTQEGGRFLYPRLDEEGFADEYGYPTALSIGDFYWSWSKATTGENPSNYSLSRWTRWQTPETMAGPGEDMYDGDIIQATWIEGLREITIRYVVEYFGIPEGRWCINELGTHEGREYVALSEIGEDNRRLKHMSIIGHRWEQRSREPVLK